MGCLDNINNLDLTKKSDLQTCPMLWCDSKLVYLVERYQINDMEWKVTLLCPDCWTKRELTVDRESVRQLLKNNRLGREKLMKQLDEMQKKNMTDETDKFITALENDHILPIDF